MQRTTSEVVHYEDSMPYYSVRFKIQGAIFTLVYLDFSRIANSLHLCYLGLLTSGNP